MQTGVVASRRKFTARRGDFNPRHMSQQAMASCPATCSMKKPLDATNHVHFAGWRSRLRSARLAWSRASQRNHRPHSRAQRNTSSTRTECGPVALLPHLRLTTAGNGLLSCSNRKTERETSCFDGADCTTSLHTP